MWFKRDRLILLDARIVRSSADQQRHYPFALPELTFYRLRKQSGYARFHLDLTDNRTGESIGPTETLMGRTYYDQYAVLFLLLGPLRT